MHCLTDRSVHYTAIFKVVVTTNTLEIYLLKIVYLNMSFFLDLPHAYMHMQQHEIKY